MYILSQVPVVPQLLCLFYISTCGATSAVYILSQVPVVPQPTCVSVSGTYGATTALSLLSSVPVVPQLHCIFYLRYMWCHNCSASSNSGTCGATTAPCLLSQVPVVPQLPCLFCLRYLRCHNCSVSSISGTCFCYLRLLYISHVSSCHLAVPSCTLHAYCYLRSLRTISLVRHTPNPSLWLVAQLW